MRPTYQKREMGWAKQSPTRQFLARGKLESYDKGLNQPDDVYRGECEVWAKATMTSQGKSDVNNPRGLALTGSVQVEESTTNIGPRVGWNRLEKAGGSYRTVKREMRSTTFESLTSSASDH